MSGHAPTLRIISRRHAAGVVIDVAGEIDLATSRQLQTELDAAEHDGDGRLVVDLGRVEFIDSIGLRTLLQAQALTHARGGRFLLREPSAAVLRVFDAAGVADVFEVTDD